MECLQLGGSLPQLFGQRNLAAALFADCARSLDTNILPKDTTTFMKINASAGTASLFQVAIIVTNLLKELL
jgi:hypothetical protein